MNNDLLDQFKLKPEANWIGNVMQIHSTEDSYGFIGIRGPTSTASFICKITCTGTLDTSFND